MQYRNQFNKDIQNKVQTSRVRRPKFEDADRLFVGTPEERMRLSRERARTRMTHVASLAVEARRLDRVKSALQTTKTPTPEPVDEPQAVPEEESETADIIRDLFKTTAPMIDFDTMYPIGTVYNTVNDTTVAPFKYGAWKHMGITANGITQWVRIL